MSRDINTPVSNSSYRQQTHTRCAEGLFRGSHAASDGWIRIICNRVSLFAQHYGSYLSISNRLEFDADADHAKQRAVEGARQFCQFLENKAAVEGNKFAAAMQLEREGLHIICRIVAYAELLREHDDAAEVSISSDAKMWAAEQRARVDVRFPGDRAPSACCAEHIGKLCSGLKEW